jgi:predicted RNase H-like HicB family nuclease
MKKAYPVILSPAGDGWYVATVPDLDVNTQGKDLADAIYMARDVIGWRGIDMENAGQTLPEASAIETVKGSGAEDVVTLVDVDFDEYRRQNDLRSVKKNCTIPAWLNYEAEKRGINFSALLQSALKKELSVKDPEKNAG